MKVQLYINCHAEFDDDASEEMRRSFEIATARWRELLELTLVEALERVKRDHPDLQFKFVGEDEDE